MCGAVNPDGTPILYSADESHVSYAYNGLVNGQITATSQPNFDGGVW